MDFLADLRALFGADPLVLADFFGVDAGPFAAPFPVLDLVPAKYAELVVSSSFGSSLAGFRLAGVALFGFVSSMSSSSSDTTFLGRPLPAAFFGVSI